MKISFQDVTNIKTINKTYCILFFPWLFLNPHSPVCFLHLEHLSIWAWPIPSAWQSHVATILDSVTGPCLCHSTKISHGNTTNDSSIAYAKWLFSHQTSSEISVKPLLWVTLDYTYSLKLSPLIYRTWLSQFLPCPSGGVLDPGRGTHCPRA